MKSILKHKAVILKAIFRTQGEYKMMKLPKAIESRLESHKFLPDNIGLSKSKLYLFENQVLKIGEDNEEAENEYIIMEWLKDKLPVPKVLAFDKAEGKSWLLMTRVQGKMSCDEEYMKDPIKLTELLADALKLLWHTDVTECPCIWNIDRKLEMAEYSIVLQKSAAQLRRKIRRQKI